MAGDGVVSAPAADRAAELPTMLLDPAVRAVVPP
jgi:muramoyltetrapeptide carboxypeptidase